MERSLTPGGGWPSEFRRPLDEEPIEVDESWLEPVTAGGPPAGVPRPVVASSSPPRWPAAAVSATQPRLPSLRTALGWPRR